jgi:uncharacterized protein (DUF362 family)
MTMQTTVTTLQQRYNHKIVTCDKNTLSEKLPKILSILEFTPNTYRLVLVKPNLCGIYHPHNQLIECVLRLFESHAQRIVIGETPSTVRTPEEQFERLGIWDVVTPFDDRVQAINLMKDEVLDLAVPSAHAITSLPIPRLVHTCNFLVNIPKIGTHSRTVLTCALKNLFGLLAEKQKYDIYHPLGVDKVIADVAKVVRCDLNVVDAGDTVIVGLDPLVVDVFACRFVNLNPQNIEHLQLVAQDRNLRLQQVINELQVINL